jgi:hypothetical protein
MLLFLLKKQVTNCLPPRLSLRAFPGEISPGFFLKKEKLIKHLINYNIEILFMI